MAFTRKLLKAMGLTDEQVDSVMDAHVDVVNGLKEESGRYKTDADKLADVQKELDALKATGDYKSRYDAEHAAFEAYKAEQTEKQQNAVKVKAVREALKQAGVNRPEFLDLLEGKVDLKTVELDGEKVKDSAFADTLKTAFPGCFGTVQTTGAEKLTPPTGGAKTAMTKEQIMQIKDASERQQAIADNMAAFGH